MFLVIWKGSSTQTTLYHPHVPSVIIRNWSGWAVFGIRNNGKLFWTLSDLVAHLRTHNEINSSTNFITSAKALPSSFWLGTKPGIGGVIKFTEDPCLRFSQCSCGHSHQSIVRYFGPSGPYFFRRKNRFEIPFRNYSSLSLYELLVASRRLCALWL